MNTFFYSSRQASCPAGCTYPDCPERCLATLKRLPELADMQALPGGALFPLSQDLQLRCGDLIIVHVANHLELEQLVAHRDALAHYRLVLIINDDLYDTSRRYHQLNPRFITTSRQASDHLETVIRRIAIQAEGRLENGRHAALPTM